MRTLLSSSLIALGLAGAACDRKGDEISVEATKPVEPSTIPQTPPPASTNELDAERNALARTLDERTAALDARIDALEQRGDAQSKEAVATLRAKRDQARAKLTELGSRTQENWGVFKRDVESAWDQLERDVNEATR